MKPCAWPMVAVAAVLAIGATGCTSERTRNMAETCQGLLEDGDQASARTFIRDAGKQLSSLNKPGNKLTGFLRDLQDPDAMVHKAALEQCLWMLKSRQA